MMKRLILLAVAITALSLIVLPLLLGGCGSSGVSEEEFKALQDQVGELEGKVNEYQSKVDAYEIEVRGLEELGVTLVHKLIEFETHLSVLDGQLQSIIGEPAQ